MTWTRRWLIIGCLLSLPVGAMAAREELQVRHAWSRPAMAGRTGVIYLTITDHGAADRLVGAHSAVARKAELHETIDDHGIMKMRAVPSLAIPANGTVTLKPGGYHIMLVGLKHALHAGDSVPLTLTFAKAGKREAMAMVEGPGAGKMRSGGMNMHH
ncbi:MAG TPA: copper chaperone PCu(A)C [Acetobacteraceae bacterium]|nr:copper chaperone PCu(A)C [Acetobacteraceae bacterium]